MASSSPFSILFYLLIVFLSVSLSQAEIRTSEVQSDNRLIIPSDEFGFTHTGRLELNVTDIALSNPNPNLDSAKVGFFLCTGFTCSSSSRMASSLALSNRASSRPSTPSKSAAALGTKSRIVEALGFGQKHDATIDIPLDSMNDPTKKERESLHRGKHSLKGGK